MVEDIGEKTAISIFEFFNNAKQEEIEYSKVVQKFQNQEVKRYYVDNTGKLYLSSEESKSDKLDLNSFEFVHNLADIQQFREDLSDLIFAQTSL